MQDFSKSCWDTILSTLCNGSKVPKSEPQAKGIEEADLAGQSDAFSLIQKHYVYYL